MASPEKSKSGNEPKENVNPSEEVLKSPEGKKVGEEVRKDLDKLRKDIEEGKMSFELAKTYLESLDKVSDKDYKAFILGGILSGLNQRGISIEGVKEGKIILKAGVQSLIGKLDIATHEETISYENLINNYLSSGKITLKDLNKGLLYRTSALDDYLKEKVEGQETSTSEYVLRLLEKYKIYITGPSLETFEFENEEQYNRLKKIIKSSITDNQADKEFLLGYFDDIYFNGKKGIQENSIEDYKKSSRKIESGLFKRLNELSDDQKFALGLRNKDDAKELAKKWKNNPLEAAKEAFTNGGGLLGVILGIIGSIFWGKKGFLGGFIGGMALVGGLPAFAGELAGEEETSGTPLNNLTRKYSGLFNENIGNLKKEKLTYISNKLLNNQKFLESDSSKLNIFTDGTKQKDIEKYFNSIGLVLNEENRPYYEQIFKSYIEKRNKDGISGPIVGENIITYLTKTSNTLKKPEEENPEGENPKGEIANPSQESDYKDGENLYKELQRQGWSELYIFTKMLSLGYIPKFHDMKYQKEFSGNKIKWIWNNSRYVAMGGPFTNGNVNTYFTEQQEKIRNYCSKLFIGEERQLRILLNSIKGADTNANRYAINNQLEKLNELKTAIESGNLNNIEAVSKKYSDACESAKKVLDVLGKGGRLREVESHVDVDSEMEKIKMEIKNIDDEISRIKDYAEKKLEELNYIASRNPEKVPELRAEIEKIIGEMNKQIADLESKGVTKLQKLNPKKLELLSKNSKWTQAMINANGGIDRLLSGKTGKIVGVSAIILLSKGVYDGISQDGISSELALDATDLGIGMIPVVGGIYDIGMAIRGTDLNGREMQNSERLMRAGFGVIGIIPLVGTAVKWMATGAKTTTKAVELAQRGELITQTGLVIGKVAGVGTLLYGGIGTITYELPTSKK